MGAVTTDHQPSSRRVALTLRPEVLNRAETEQRKIAQKTGIKPSLAAVLAAAAERGLTAS